MNKNFWLISKNLLKFNTNKCTQDVKKTNMKTVWHLRQWEIVIAPPASIQRRVPECILVKLAGGLRD